MQREKNNVRHCTDIEHIFSENAAALVLSLGAHRVKIGLFLPDGELTAEAVFHRKNILKRAGVALQSQKHIHQNCLVSE